MKGLIYSLKSFVWESWVISFSIILSLFRADKLLKAKSIRRIIIYHDISYRDLENFKRQIRYLVKNYRVLSLSEFLRKIESRNCCDENMLCITLDDAFGCIYDRISPILDQYQIKPCIFVPVGFLEAADKSGFVTNNINSEGEKDSLSWSQLKELLKRGYEVGSHSYNHVDFGKEGIDFEHELLDSKNYLQNKLGAEVRYFAFPFGKSANISTEALIKLKEYGYAYAFSGICGNVDNTNFLLPRTYINSKWPEKILKFVLLGFFDKSIKKRLQ